LKFQTPADVSARSWEVVCDTFDPAREGAAAGPLDVGARSILVLRAPRGRTAMT
jgi:isoamylase